MDSKYIFTTGSDGIVFIYKISEFFPARKGRFAQVGVSEENSEDMPKIKDELAEIVLVNKSFESEHLFTYILPLFIHIGHFQFR